MATKFSDAQVASYIQNNALSGAGLQQAAQAFQLAPDQLARAQGLLSSGDASVAAAGNAYNQQVAGRPDLVAQNLAAYNPATGIGSLVQPQALTPAPVTPPPPTGLSSAQTKYYDQLLAGGGYDKQTALEYVRGLNDLQSLASLANTQGKFQNIAQGSADQQIQQLEQLYNAPIISHLGRETRNSTYTPVLYKDLTKTSTPDQVAAAYSQLANAAGGDTATNQKEAVAYLQKIGVPDSVIRSGYNVYKGLGTTAPVTATNKTTTGATTTAAASTEPLYKSLTANSTSDDIARAYYQLTSGAGGDTQANQQEAVAFLQKLGISNPLIESGYKDYREMAGLKSSFGLTDTATKPTTEGILSGFKYANEKGLDENTMEQVLGNAAFSTYKTGLADYAKTGIASVLSDGKLSFDEASSQVKLGRDLGYDTQKLADLTGTDKKVFDAIYKNYEENVPKVIASALKESPDVKNSDDQIVKALALGQKYGFTDDDFAKALGFTTPQVKGLLDPVRNYGTQINQVLNNTDSTLADTKKIIESGKANGAINKLFGTNLNTLDAKIAEIEDRWKGFEGVEPMHAQRVYDQISQQREKLGDQYYRGVFGDPKTMAATLARKGIDTLADIGQKDKFEATPAIKRYTTKDGAPVEDVGDGSFIAEGSFIPKDQVKTVYGYNEYEASPDGESQIAKFVPLSDKDVDKEGNYQKLVGKVAIDKDTGEEIADLDGRIASQSSSGGLRKKFNTLNVAFTKDGVPVVTAASERAGLGGLVQDLAPIISMALPFVLPGLGSALSSMLPGAGVAASGAAAAIPASLMNQALTQGIISGGLTTLGGGQFEKGFLSGAVSPVINTGISNLLPAGINPDLAKSITSAGTGAVQGALRGGDFSDILKGGITSGLANYGVNTALGASGLTPQQLNFATGIVAPLLQGQKINPVTAFGTLANAGQQTQGARP